MSEYTIYNGAYSGPEVDAALARAKAGGAIDAEIAALKAAVGSPLIASTAAAMTDINKIYVYTGSEAGYTFGHWYYYNGSAWTDGGVYNSTAFTTDTTLTVSGAAADAKVAGDEISDLKSAFENSYADKLLFFYRGTLNTSTGAITKSETNMTRIVTDKQRKGLYKYIVRKEQSLSYYVAYYDNSGDFVKVVGWNNANAFLLEEYPYIAILAKKGNDDTFSSTQAGLYLSECEDVPAVDTINDNIKAIASCTVNELTYINGVSRPNANPQGMATTRRWFLAPVFEAGVYVTNIELYAANAKTGTLYIELWEKAGDTLTKYDSLTVSVDGFYPGTINTIPINRVCEVPTMIALVGVTDGVRINFETPTPKPLIYTSTDVSTETTTLNYTSLEAWNNVWPKITVYCTRKKTPKNIIYVGENEFFTEIQDAITAITDDTATNKYTIIVRPKSTPYSRFSMIRNLSASYPWSNVSPRYISIIGENKEYCVVRSDTGNYFSPPAELMTNGVIKNITFIMTHDEQDTTATQGGYCLHIDCRTKDDVGYKMVIEDCDFENDSGPCIGVGLHENCDLTIRRCHLKTTLSENYAPYEGYRNLYDFGVVFAHTSTLSTAQNQHITFEDCVGVCTDGTRSLWLAPAGEYSPSTAEFVYTLIRNVFWNITQNDPAYGINATLDKDPMTFGNNSVI